MLPNYVNTADATAEPKDIKNGETAWAKGKEITGTQGFSLQNGVLICPNDWYVEGTTLVIPDSWLEKNGG